MNKEKKRVRPDMEPFFEAGSVVVLGASPEFHKPSGRPVEGLIKHGYRGKIFLVNPKYDEIAGIKCYPSVLDIPEDVELAVLAVSARGSIDLLRQCAEKGIKGVVVIASGFGEVGGEGLQLEREMTSLARETGIRIMGPNCLGMINNINKLWASFGNIQTYGEEYYDYPHRFSLISQSGFFGSVICSMNAMQRVGFNHFASVGNQADLTFTDFFEYIVDDPGSSIITGYIEGIKDGRRFMDAAKKARQLQKPVVVMKVGRTEVGARAASSHTGSLAGSDRIYDAVFKQTGIIRADGLNHLLAAINFAAGGRWPRGNRVAMISSAGGASVIMSDKCEKLGLEVVQLTDKTRRALDEILPSFGSSANPVDLTAQLASDPDMLFKSIKLVAEDPNVDIVIISLWLPRDDMVDTVARQLTGLRNSVDKCLLIMGEPRGRDKKERILSEKLARAGFPIISDIDMVAWASSAMAGWASRLKNAHEKTPLPPPGAEREKALSIIKTAGGKFLSEHRASEILQAYGIATPRGELVSSAVEAVAAAEKIGYPVALKVQSPDILHKTDVGGLALNLSSSREVTGAYRRILDSVRKESPHARLEGILVQEMLSKGTEVIIGLKYDQVFGPAIMFGLGGIFVEVLEDVSFRVAPLTRSDAREMIREIQGYRILEGLRGAPPADTDALEELLLKISRLAVELSGEIEEMDINPLFVFPRGEGAAAADALITLKGSS